MASAEGLGGSLDFDFFETPRDDDRLDEVHQTSLANKPPRHPQQTDADHHSKTLHSNDEQSASKHVSKKTSDRLSDSDSYSSDYSVSDSDDDLSQAKNRNSTKKDKRKPEDSFSDSGSDSHSDKHMNGSRSQRSHSSASSKSSDGRPSNPIAKTPSSQQAMPKRGKSRLGEDEYSSSAYSEGEDSARIKTSSRSNSESSQGSSNRDRPKQKQAWGEGSSQRYKDKQKTKSGRVRPNTAKGRKSESGASTSVSRRRQRSKSRSDSEALSDSDITDVSPMDSPRASNAKNRSVGAAGDGGRRNKPPKFMPMPVNNEDRGDESPKAREGGSNLDLEILMKAVGELEKQKRVQANSRRVMFAPMMSSGGREKANYTFDQTKTRDIERENQRLLHEIVRRVNSGSDQRKQFYASPATAYKLTPSAINRERDMKRIESENMAFLKRLQKVKPTSNICRDHQLQSYEKTTLHGVPIAALHPLPGRSHGSRSGSSVGGRRRSGASSVADSASLIGSRTRSMTSIHSGASSVRSSNRGSRPSSATIRPSSATKRLDTRPEWSDRW